MYKKTAFIFLARSFRKTPPILTSTLFRYTLFFVCLLSSCANIVQIDEASLTPLILETNPEENPTPEKNPDNILDISKAKKYDYKKNLEMYHTTYFVHTKKINLLIEAWVQMNQFIFLDIKDTWNHKSRVQLLYSQAQWYGQTEKTPPTAIQIHRFLEKLHPLLADIPPLDWSEIFFGKFPFHMLPQEGILRSLGSKNNFLLFNASFQDYEHQKRSIRIFVHNAGIRLNGFFFSDYIVFEAKKNNISLKSTKFMTYENKSYFLKNIPESFQQMINQEISL